MKNEYTAVVKQDGDWWIGWIEEVPVDPASGPAHDLDISISAAATAGSVRVVPTYG